jgi:hypothetical protein
MSTPSRAAEPVAGPTFADFYGVNRGGGLFSQAVSQRVGARFALAAYRRRLAPTVLTAANLGLSCLVSAAVVAAALPVAHGRLPAWPVGLLALVGWQVAYALDCADGQFDVAAQLALVAALAETAKAQVPATPAWLLAAFAGTWMVNLVTSVLQHGPEAASLVTSQSLPVRIVKLVRDYGAVIALAGLVLTLAPDWTVLVVAAFTVVNGGFLAASIVYASREALRR